MHVWNNQSSCPLAWPTKTTLVVLHYLLGNRVQNHAIDRVNPKLQLHAAIRNFLKIGLRAAVYYLPFLYTNRSLRVTG